YLYVVYLVYCWFIYYFFCQAEDGIRDFHVTGVQTCALPISCEAREVRGGQLLTFDITDKTDSITVKAFVRGEADAKPPVKKGQWVKVRGRAEIDRFTQELVIDPSAVAEAPPRRRTADHPEKREALHLHTKMSSLHG